MFCPKCGTKALDDATFCQKCGAKLITDDATQQAPIATPVRQIPKQNVSSDSPKKKKSKKLPIILGAAALFIILIVIVSGSNKGDNQGNVTPTTTNSRTEAVSLSETFTNDTTGISFNYPAGWEILTSENKFQIVNMIDSKNNADSIAKFEVYCIFDQDPFGVFTKSDEAVREAVNEFGTFLTLEDTLIGNIPAKGLKYQASGLKGDDIVSKFWYVIGENVYQVTCSYSASKADTYEPVFSSIMNSYTIAVTAEPTSTLPTSEDDAQELIEKWFAENLPGYELTIEFQYDEGAYVFNLILDSGAGDSLFLTAFVDKGTGEISIGEGQYNQPVGQWLENMMGSANGEMGYDEYASPAPMDSALYGRWRASDGSILELSETGTVVKTNFRVWIDPINTPDSIHWEASNGQILFDSQFNCEYEWSIERTQELDFDVLILKLNSNSTRYHRVEGTAGEGLVGQWDIRSPMGGNLTLNADGTGTVGNSSCTWQADDSMLWEYIHQKCAYDYYVSGDLLELFFSDGSKIFTKVGN